MAGRISVRVVDVYPYRVRPGKVEFLLLKRADGTRYAGSWRMVGGKIRPGERSPEAALRELHEETALAPVVFWALPSPNIFFEWEADRVNVVPAFAAEVRSDPVLDSEHTAFVWLDGSAAGESVVYPEQARLISRIEAVLERGIPQEWIIPTNGEDEPEEGRISTGDAAFGRRS